MAAIDEKTMDTKHLEEDRTVEDEIIYSQAEEKKLVRRIDLQ